MSGYLFGYNIFYNIFSIQKCASTHTTHTDAPPYSYIVKYIGDMLQNIVEDTCRA